MKKVIFTGLQPTADGLHIGNYFGAIMPTLNLQGNDDNITIYLFVADLHAITNPEVKMDPKNKENLLCTYVASGFDLKKTHLFFQSDVPAHVELGWVLTCNTTYGELSRMTQFKDKSAKLTQANGTESIPAGLLVYPPLMAADILLYDTNIVPVGADQKQHVEITRNIAERFNNKYGKTFVIPEPLIEEDHGKINDLQDPTKKMSKSAKNHNGVIFLNDTKEEVTAKIKSALTDNFNSVKYDPKNQPAVSNLVLIYHLISGMSIDQIENKYRGIKNYGEFKKDLTTIVVDFLTDFQSKYAAAKKNIKSIMKQIMENTKVVSSIADKKVNLVYKRIGLR